MSNRHTSLYQRGDSSNQLPKHLLNVNGDSVKTATTNSIASQESNGNKINNLNKSDKQHNCKDNETPAMICIK